MQGLLTGIEQVLLASRSTTYLPNTFMGGPDSAWYSQLRKTWYDTLVRHDLGGPRSLRDRSSSGGPQHHARWDGIAAVGFCALLLRVHGTRRLRP